MRVKGSKITALIKTFSASRQNWEKANSMEVLDKHYYSAIAGITTDSTLNLELLTYFRRSLATLWGSSYWKHPFLEFVLSFLQSIFSLRHFRCYLLITSIYSNCLLLNIFQGKTMIDNFQDFTGCFHGLHSSLHYNLKCKRLLELINEELLISNYLRMSYWLLLGDYFH